MGRDVRAWPMLASLALVMVVAVGCVLWFMREAMRNERMAVREKLVEAYRSQLTLVQAQTEARWNERLGQLGYGRPAPNQFDRCVRSDLADSVICLDERGRPAYPRLTSADDEALRNVEANAELLKLESPTPHMSPPYIQLMGGLRARVSNYSGDGMPSAQRRFIMHELQRLDPNWEFPTLAAEELAARYLDAGLADSTGEPVLRATKLPGVWSVSSRLEPRVLALFTTGGLRRRLGGTVRDSSSSLPRGVRIVVSAPGEDTMSDSTIATMPIGQGLPGWRLTLSLDNDALFDTEAERRVARYLVIGSCVIAAMLVLAIFMARGFGRQVQLARLKNDLVATVSHELKTPLTAMRALVDTLLDAQRFDEKMTREYLKLLATENARLSRLIDNFLTFSRLERNKFTFEFTRVRPQQIVEGAVTALGERAQAPGCMLESHTAVDLPSIRGDVDALVTALLNLLDNAWKYSGDEKHIVLRTEARNGSVCFAVEDNGIGLTPRESKRVFHRFYQTDQGLSRSVGGCGLGLSIVQSIVEAHHGSVRVESEPGRGSTFTIEIPAIADGAS